MYQPVWHQRLNDTVRNETFNKNTLTCAIALLNRPSLCWPIVCADTLPPPADSPNMVTRSGSPPNCAMFCLTQSKAAL